MRLSAETLQEKQSGDMWNKYQISKQWSVLKGLTAQLHGCPA